MNSHESFLRQIQLKRQSVSSYNYYPFNLGVIKSPNKLDFHPKVTYIVGENGMGKSTLMESIAVAWGFNPEGGKSLHEQSHGESFFSTFVNRFGGKGLYILDEPEAALSPLRQMAMLARIHELVQQNSQFIISTHSPILMAYPDSIIYNLKPDGIEIRSLEETDHYVIMRKFLNNKDNMLKQLFENQSKDE